MTSNISLNARAQTNYSSPLKDNDEFIWEVRELDLHNFKKVFGFEPVFEVGDQIKKKIIDILGPESYGWSLTVEEWDYDSDFNAGGKIKYDVIPKYPQDYDENIFIPTPVNEYLLDALHAETFISSGDGYSVSGSILTKLDKGPFGDTFRMEKEYDFRGVLVSEKYISTPDERVIVHVSGTWAIPFGSYFFGFMAIGIIGIVILMIKKNKYQAH